MGPSSLDETHCLRSVLGQYGMRAGWPHGMTVRNTGAASADEVDRRLFGSERNSRIHASSSAGRDQAGACRQREHEGTRAEQRHWIERGDLKEERSRKAPED